MKTNLKKQKLILITIVLILVTIFPIVTYAVDEISKAKLVEKSASFSQWEELQDDERKNTIQPFFFDINLKDSIKRSKYNQYLKESTTDRKSYNLKDTLNNISSINVKNQQKTGACWAFSYSNVIETTIANKYNRAVKEYSPMHIDYATAKIFNRTVGAGGNSIMALAYGASGVGPVYEEDFPFANVYDEVNNSKQSYYLTDISKVELNQKSRARVEDATIFAPIYKSYSTDSITYKDSNALFGANRYTEEQVNALRGLIKKHIIENGAVSAIFYSDMGITSNDEIVSQRGYYNSATKAYYSDSTIYSANHAVTIVGWDDEFKKENFAANKQPLNDGAYIVLNSWGEEFADNGYFYVSYDDAFIEQSLVGINEVAEIENEQEIYDNIYEYDELGVNYALYSINEKQTQYLDSGYAANVFTRKQNTQTEYLSEVGIFLIAAEGVEIYVNPTDDNIENCTLVGSYTGNNALEAGYHTLKLASPVQLKGDKFVIKIKYINSEKVTIPIECNLRDSGLATSDTGYETATSNEGESFISYNGTKWNDLDNYVIDEYTFKNTSACIKAFTTVSEGETTVAVTGVTLDKEKVTIKEGQTTSLVEKVLPENATNKNITWTSSNTNVATVSNGVITGEAEGTATITVTTVDGNFTDTCTVTVEKEETIPENVAVTEVTLDKEKVTIKEGQTTNLVATVLPENATNPNITWTSSNTNVATVLNGVIKGEAEGTATITVTTVDGNFTDTCTVTVEKEETMPENVAVTEVTLDKDEVTIKEGQTTNLVATVLPENATNPSITWTSSNTNVATVSNGVITGVEEGTATITVKTVDGNFSDTCIVIVEKNSIVKVTGIELNKDSLNMQVGERTNLVATIKPTNATNKDVIWSSSNQKVATISENGIIEALKEGKTTITVMTKDGSYKASCEVTVTKKTNTEDDIYTNNQYKPEKNDSTTAQKELPKAGINTIITIIGISIVVTIAIFKKYRGYNDIK